MILKYQTARLAVSEITYEIASEIAGKTANPIRAKLLQRTVALLTPPVVENLPPYFHHIHSVTDAAIWLESILADSRLFVIERKEAEHKEKAQIIGFLFAHTSQDKEAHIGYLLGEEYWGKGLASELLAGFIELAAQEKAWRKLLGGVDKTNLASAHLLTKLGFTEQASRDESVVFYEYLLP